MSPSGTDGCQSVVTFWHHYNFKYSSRQAVFLGFEILKWSDSFKEKMCRGKKKGEREGEKDSVAFPFFLPPPLLPRVGNLWLLFGNENPITEVIIWWGFWNRQAFSPSLFLYLMITLNGPAPHGTARASQFCSPLISAFEAQGSEAVAKQTPHQAGSKIRQSSLPETE